MTSMNSGLDPRGGYDFARIAACQAPIWRTWVCPTHGGYNDIVAVMLPMSQEHKDHLKCGCMQPYNESARHFTQERTSK